MSIMVKEIASELNGLGGRFREGYKSYETCRDVSFGLSSCSHNSKGGSGWKWSNFERGRTFLFPEFPHSLDGSKRRRRDFVVLPLSLASPDPAAEAV
jgi:hypothetical protein